MSEVEHEATARPCQHTESEFLYADEESHAQWCGNCGAARESFSDPWQVPKAAAHAQMLAALVAVEAIYARDLEPGVDFYPRCAQDLDEIHEIVAPAIAAGGRDAG